VSKNFFSNFHFFFLLLPLNWINNQKLNGTISKVSKVNSRWNFLTGTPLKLSQSFFYIFILMTLLRLNNRTKQWNITLYILLEKDLHWAADIAVISVMTDYLRLKLNDSGGGCYRGKGTIWRKKMDLDLGKCSPIQ
jgi:hypothetical protein